MKSCVVSQRRTSLENERPKDGLHQGPGAMLLLAGSALLFFEPRMDRSSVGGGLGFLLVLVGSGLMIFPRPWEAHPAP